MILSYQGIQDTKAWADAGVVLPSYDWKQIDWTTYARLGLGARFKVSGGDEAKINPFSWSFVLGMVYHL